MDNKNFINDVIPTNEQGWLLEHFNQAVRNGFYQPSEIINYVRVRINKYLIRPNLPEDKVKALNAFLAMLATPGALQYAQSIVDYENLPPLERTKIKTAKQEQYKNNWLATQQPTTKQLNYIEMLGYQGQLPINRLEATLLINKLLKEKGQPT
jgi:hypothetical protein